MALTLYSAPEYTRIPAMDRALVHQTERTCAPQTGLTCQIGGSNNTYEKAWALNVGEERGGGGFPRDFSRDDLHWPNRKEQGQTAAGISLCISESQAQSRPLGDRRHPSGMIIIDY